MEKIIPAQLRMLYRGLLKEVSEDWEFVSDMTPEKDEHGSYFDVSLTKWNLCFKMYVEQEADKNKITRVVFDREASLDGSPISPEQMDEAISILKEQFPVE